MGHYDLEMQRRTPSRKLERRDYLLLDFQPGIVVFVRIWWQRSELSSQLLSSFGRNLRALQTHIRNQLFNMPGDEKLRKDHEESDSEEEEEVEIAPMVDIDVSKLTPLSPEVISKQVSADRSRISRSFLRNVFRLP
jgi:hypothetical protein